MEHKKSLLSKVLLTVVLPVVLIFCATAGIAMSVVSQNFNQFGEIQNNIVLIFGIGLVVMVGVSVLGIKGISSRLTSLAETANRLSEGDVEVVYESGPPQDQLGEVAYALSGLAKNMQLQS